MHLIKADKREKKRLKTKQRMTSLADQLKLRRPRGTTKKLHVKKAP